MFVDKVPLLRQLHIKTNSLFRQSIQGL